MFNCYVGGWDCSAEIIRENNWEPDFVATTLEEALRWIDDNAYGSDTGWIEVDGEIRHSVELW